MNPGTRVGPYDILAPLGAGGMGEVYRARDARLNREVAIKILPPAASRDPARIGRFQQEARAAGSLNHANILAVYDIGETDDRVPYLVSELLEGETLRERLGQRAVPIRKAIDAAVQIAHGLAAAHARGIVHRDLKPENLFVTRDGSVKILDFGLAKLIHDERDRGTPKEASHGASTMAPVLTDSGMILGTVGYMSPEQIRGGPVDHRADLFALGAIVYEMLSGTRAFHRETSAETMTAILKEDVPEAALAARQISPALERIVFRCLEKDPAKRFQSADDLAFALDGLSSASGDARLTSHAVASHPKARTWRWAPAGVALIALGATAGALGARSFVRSAEPATRALRAAVLPPAGVDVGGLASGPTPGKLALSPDGAHLAFIARGDDGIPRLWVRTLDEQVARSLTGTEAALFPFWAPDSTAIGYFSRNGEIRRVGRAGGPPQTVMSVASQPDARLAQNWAVGASWGPDNAIVVAMRDSAIRRLDTSRGSLSPVTTLDSENAEAAHVAPSFLPDGRHFVYVAMGPTRDPRGIFVGSIDGGPSKRLMEGGSNATFASGHLLFVRDGALMAQPLDVRKLELTGNARVIANDVTVDGVGLGAFTVSHNGTLAYLTGVAAADRESQLVWRSLDGQQLGRLGELSVYRDVDLSPDAHTLVVSRRDRSGNRDIWTFDVRRGLPTRFTTAGDDEVTAVWAPDGSRIIFNRNEGVPPRFNLYEGDANNPGKEMPLRIDDRTKWPAAVSPDGRYLLYDREGGTPGKTDTWLLPLEGERTPRALFASAANEGGSQFSPDGRWIAYHSNESGGFEVYVVPFPGPGRPVRVSGEGGRWPRWRRDQKALFFLNEGPSLSSLSDNRLMAAEVTVREGAIEVGAMRTLFDAPIPGSGRGVPYAVTPDGQRFLLNAMVEGVNESSISLIVNWPAILRDPEQR